MAQYHITGSTQNIDGGVIRNGGTIASSRWTSKGLGDTKYQLTPGVQISGSVAKAVSAGTLATMAADHFIMRRITTTLAGVANDTLLSGGSDYGQRRSIHSNTTYKTSFLSSLSWTADKDGAPTYSLGVTNRTLTYGQDDAAEFSYSKPGELVIKTAAPLPEQKDYSPKTGA